MGIRRPTKTRTFFCKIPSSSSARTREVLFAVDRPLEFADRVLVESTDGSLHAEASVVAVQYHPERTVVAVRFLKHVPKLDCEIMTASTQPSFQLSLKDQAAALLALQPMYAALVREFVIEASTCPVDKDHAEEFSAPPSRSSRPRPGSSRSTRRSRCTSCASSCRPRLWPTKPCCAIFFRITCTRP